MVLSPFGSVVDFFDMRGLSRILLLGSCLRVVLCPLYAQDTKEAQNIEDKGDFSFRYGQVKRPEHTEILKVLKEERVLETIAAELNKHLALPCDLTVALAECGQVNAFYNPRERSISICLELITSLVEQNPQSTREDDKEEEGEDEPPDFATGTLLFILFHELGHALVDIYDLPITGKEEDAVDQLATLLLVEDGGDEGIVSAIYAAAFFWRLGKEGPTERKKLLLWDEHSLGEQRFFNIMSWLYGHDPEKLGFVVKVGFLPKERAVRSRKEWEQMKKAWSQMLQPYRKDEGEEGEEAEDAEGTEHEDGGQQGEDTPEAEKNEGGEGQPEGQPESEGEGENAE